MALKLYVSDPNPGVRAIYMLAEIIGVKFEKIPLNLMKREQFTPEFLKLNPQHTVPTLIDGDFAICDSHVICTYLISKYAPNDSLYPRDDLKLRANIDQRLHLDNSTLFKRLHLLCGPVLKGETDKFEESLIEGTHEEYALVEELLSRNKFIAGDQLTIADLMISSTLVTTHILVPIAAEKYPKITAWLEHMKQMPMFDKCNKNGLDMFSAMMLPKLKK